MTGDEIDSALRARIAGAVDPVAPGPAAHERISLAVREAISGTPPRRTGRLFSAAAAGLVAAALAGALGASLVLSHRGGGQNAGVPSATMSASPTPPATPTASPTASPVPSPTPVSARSVLAPAAVPPAPGVVECDTPVARTADGNVTPLFCDGGGIDVPAWNFYASLHPGVMRLGYAATAAQVRAAICADMATGQMTVPEEANAAVVAGRYYGWDPDSYDTFANDASTC